MMTRGGARGPASRLTTSVHDLLDNAEANLASHHAARIPGLRARLDGPLRVAIAGKVKAGKSTLLNALIGEKVAPTDAGECTRIVTWYRNSHVYRVTAIPYTGPPTELGFRRTATALEIDLAGLAADDVRYLDVEWPSQRLQDMVLIDTPGLGSISTDVSERTQRSLAADEEGPGEADAVVYLMRHLHPMDLSFLEAFKDSIATAGTSVNSIAVLSRADEIGSARTNAMLTAERVAQRYRTDARVRGLCQIVIPVAGLIGQAANSLSEDEASALRTLAELDSAQSTELLLSVGRFVNREVPGGGISTDVRRKLLDSLGLFGVRLSVQLLAAGRVESSGDVARALEARSGIEQLRAVLAGQFSARATVLKARTAIATVRAMADVDGGAAGRALKQQIRDIENAAHELVEIRLLTELQSLDLGLGGAANEARRLLGGDGHEAPIRLGLGPNASPDDVREAAIATIGQWRDLGEDPMLGREGREVVAGVIRSCEMLLTMQ